MTLRIRSATTLKGTTAVGGLVPTLNLDFTTPSGIGLNPLNPLVTFSRADAGPYATVTGGDGYLRLAAHNLAVYSQTPSDASWSVNGATKTSTNNADPFGTSTALLLTASGGVSSHSITQSATSFVTYTSGVTYTMSCYIKAGTATLAQLTFNASPFGASQYANFSLTGGGIVTASSGGTAYILPLSGGWYRISWTATATGSSTSAGGALFFIASGTDGRAPSFASTDTLYIAGWQVEQNRTPSYYVPTTSAAVYSTPRFDYNPTTLAPLGLLIEESRANIILQSNSFTTFPWSVVGAAITPVGTTVGPDGVSNSGWKLPTIAGTNTFGFYQSFTYTAAAYTISIYAKAGTTSNLILDFTNATNAGANFNLSTGTVVFTDTGVTASMQNVGNGWYRCIATKTTTAALGYPEFYLTNSNSANVRSFAATGSEYVYVYGMQLELGSFPTSYIPTTTASVTRAADVASITGTNFSSWYNQSEGSVVASSIYNSAAMGSGRILSIYDNSNNRAQDLFYLPGTTVIASYSNYTGYGGQLTMGSTSASTTQKGGLAYKVNNGNMFLNGAARGVINPLTIDVTPTKMQIGNYANSSYLNGTVAYIKYWNTRLTDAQLQAITT